MPNLCHLWLAVLMCMGLYFIEFTSCHGLLSFFICLFNWYCIIMVMLYLAAGSPQHLYQGMQKYVVIGLMNIYWINPSDKIFPNIICIILWCIMFIVSIKEVIIPNPPFQYPGPFLVILSVSRNVVFGDNREVSLIGT